MKNARIIRNTFGLGAVLTLSLAPSALRAGPPSSVWHHTTPITMTTEECTMKPGDTVVMVCGACKTVAVTDRRIMANPKAQTMLFTIGSKHSCGHCGGDITTVNGKTKDSMQHNCSVCGEGSAYCCVARADAK